MSKTIKKGLRYEDAIEDLRNLLSEADEQAWKYMENPMSPEYRHWVRKQGELALAVMHLEDMRDERERKAYGVHPDQISFDFKEEDTKDNTKWEEVDHKHD